MQKAVEVQINLGGKMQILSRLNLFLGLWME